MNKSILTSAVLFAGLFPAIANAATQSFSDTLNFTFTESLGSNQLELAQFDTSQGTLESITLKITYNVPQQELELDNDSDGTATGNYNFGEFGEDNFVASASTFDGSTTLSASDFNYTTQTSAFELDPNINDSTDTFDSQPGESDYFSFTTTEVTFDLTRDISSFVFSEWEGTGIVTIDLAKSYASNITNNTLNGSGTLRQASTQTTGDFTAEVIYEFTAVPEPSSYATIFGIIAIACASLRRRK